MLEYYNYQLISMSFSSAKKDAVATLYFRELNELVRAYRFGGHERAQQIISEMRSNLLDKDCPDELKISKSDQNTLVDLGKDIAAFLILSDGSVKPEEVLARQMKER